MISNRKHHLLTLIAGKAVILFIYWHLLILNYPSITMFNESIFNFRCSFSVFIFYTTSRTTFIHTLNSKGKISSFLPCFPFTNQKCIDILNFLLSFCRFSNECEMFSSRKESKRVDTASSTGQRSYSTTCSSFNEI